MMHVVSEKIAALTAGYYAVWNEPDAGLRRKAIEYSAVGCSE